MRAPPPPRDVAPPPSPPRATLGAAEAEARTPCDRTAVWEAGQPRPACTQLVTNRIFTSGVLPYAKRGSLEGLHASHALFSPTEYAFHEGRCRSR